MNILIIYAHPNPRSFNRTILDTVETTLSKRGDAIRIHDLYQMHCRAVLEPEDLIRNWRGDLPADTRREQDAVLWADGLVFIYPIWWFGPPAILKGWIDRIFTHKFAFDFGPSGMKGLLTHKKALIINTLGGDQHTYQQKRWHELLVRPMTEGVLGTCGIDHVDHRAFYSVPTTTQAARQAMLLDVSALVENL